MTGVHTGHFGFPARYFWLLGAVFGAIIAFVGVRLGFGLDPAVPFRGADALARILGFAVAAVCVGYAARAARGRRRFGWLAELTAVVAMLVGEATIFVAESTGGATPSSGVFAGVLGIAPVGTLSALWLLGKSNGKRGSRTQLTLDVVLVAMSLFVVSWVYVLDRIASTPDVDGTMRYATAVHIACDVAMLTTAMIVWSRSGVPAPRSLSFLVSGIAIIASGDIVSVYVAGAGGFHTGTPVDAFRMGAAWLIALGALFSVGEPTEASRDVRPRSRVLLPYLPLLLAGVIGVAHAAQNVSNGILLVAETLLVSAVLARQAAVLTENQRLLSEVSREAFRDSLTGLANRARFRESLERGVARARRDGSPLAVLCLDLDDFKRVNDTLGHSAGDELLIRVAGRLSPLVPKDATLARLGGDEFAVVIEGFVDLAMSIAQRVLDAFAVPILIHGVPLTVRPSIGLAVARGETTPDDLLHDADLAMYAAKREGGGCLRVFQPPRGAESVVEASAVAPSLTVDRSPSSGASRDATTGAARSARVPVNASADRLVEIDAPSRTIAVAIGVLAIAMVCVGAREMIRSGTGGPLDQIVYSAATMSAAVLVLLRSIRVASERGAWLLIASGLASSAAGDVLYYTGFVADLFYLAYYPLILGGLILLVSRRLSPVPLRIWLDAGACALTAVAVGMGLINGPFRASAEASPAGVLAGFAYPAGDLVMFGLAVSMVQLLGWRNESRWGLLVWAFGLFAIADTAFAVQLPAGSPLLASALDVCCLIGTLLIVVASWRPSPRVKPTASIRWHSYAVPALLAMVCLTVCVVETGANVVPAVVSLMVIAVRLTLSLRELSAVAEAHRRATTDDLTGLPNGRWLSSMLATASTQESVPVRIALVWLQLDGVEEVRHVVDRRLSDELLCRVAERLSETVGLACQLVRVGAHAFAVVVVEDVSATVARAKAGLVLEALAVPFALDRLTVQIGGRIGIALSPDHCDDLADLTQCAKAAVPATPAAARIAVYDSAHLESRLADSVVDDLLAAIPAGELICHYQPKINASDKTVHSVEALIRWRHPVLGLLPPGEFLPAAERAGVMRPIAAWVVDDVLAQVKEWRRDGIHLTAAVNLSATNLLDLDLVDTIRHALDRYDVPPGDLIVEITESALITDATRSTAMVGALRDLGVRLSLDDYGSGWSSLARLQSLAVDELKLDRVFVSQLTKDSRSIAIVRSTIELARSLGADLVAEGVEDVATLEILEQCGCTITQGYVHSPPLPAAQLQEWIMEYTAVHPI